jgi:prepilin signal peptidase PulO-like enzyme (type II secretory pathway)
MGGFFALLLLLSGLTSNIVNAEITYSAEHDPEVLILFFCFGLILGGFTTYILSRFAPNLPYTVVMFLLGAAFAALVSSLPKLVRSLSSNRSTTQILAS